MPTLIEITGASYPGESKESEIPAIDGVSFLPALKGKSHFREEPLYFQFGSGSAMRKGNWKLVRSGMTWELYDLASDRTETNDLSPTMPELVKDMDTAWNAWWKETTGTVYQSKKK